MLLYLSAAAIAQKAPPAKPFERFDGCVLKPDEWTDADSFRVRLPDNRLETFRLYFVDTTESRLRGKRSDKQAAYFRRRAQAIEPGRRAKIFTAGGAYSFGRHEHLIRNQISDQAHSFLRHRRLESSDSICGLSLLKNCWP